MCSQYAGLTAFELLMALALVALMVLAGVPAYQEYAQQQQLKAALARLQSDLRLARNQAINLNSEVIACPGHRDTGCADQAAWHQGWMVFADRNGDQSWQQQEPLLRQGQALARISAWGTSGRTRLRFFPGGGAPGSNGSIVLCDKRGAMKGRRLILSNSGRLRQDLLADQATPDCRLP